MTVITPKTNLGGMTYPFLQPFADWTIETSSPRTDEQLADALLKDGQTLRWVKDNVVDLTVPGMDTAQFLAQTGLALSLDKGPFVMSKRLSRVMRPFYLFRFFDANAVSIRYDVTLDTKQWDGAGLISRAFVERVGHNLSHVSDLKRRFLRRDLRESGRVEFTVLSERGQDKGHALVVDDLDVDMVLPMDTKREVKLVNGQVFVGLNTVHSSDSMNLDGQSHLNLYPFFQLDDLQRWMDAEADLFLESIASEQLSEVLARIRTTEDVEAWWLREYFASGGKAMWFAGVVKSLAMQHANHIDKTTIDKFRIPVPGGRYYVFVDTVGGHTVAPGEIRLDPQSATAWVSREDWATLADVWGGADQDDALWIVPFTDHDDTRKILAWRSPNQPGEYAVLTPSTDSHTIEWATTTEPIVYPRMDSRLLPLRIDRMPTVYRNVIQKRTFKPGIPYSIRAMDAGVRQMVENGPVLGSAVNVLMVYKALNGEMPSEMAAKIGDIIDASQKTGDPLGEVMNWVWELARTIVRSTPAIPFALHHRIQTLVPDELAETLTTTQDHWLDQTLATVQAHLHAYGVRVQALANQTMPPLAVFEHGKGWLEFGGELRALYANIVSGFTRNPFRLGEKVRMTEEQQNLLRSACENYLDLFPREAQRYILMGAFTRTYLTDRGETLSDTFAWLMGKKTEGLRDPGIADRTIEALRHFRVLEALVDTEDGVMTYFRRSLDKDTTGVPVSIKGVWYAPLAHQYPKMGSVPKDEAKAIKDQIHEAALAGRYNGQVFRVEQRQLRKVLMLDDTVFGYIQKGQEHKVGATVTIQHAVPDRDGNLHAIIA